MERERECAKRKSVTILIIKLCHGCACARARCNHVCITKCPSIKLLSSHLTVRFCRQHFRRYYYVDNTLCQKIYNRFGRHSCTSDKKKTFLSTTFCRYYFVDDTALSTFIFTVALVVILFHLTKKIVDNIFVDCNLSTRVR